MQPPFSCSPGGRGEAGWEESLAAVLGAGSPAAIVKGKENYKYC